MELRTSEGNMDVIKEEDTERGWRDPKDTLPLLLKWVLAPSPAGCLWMGAGPMGVLWEIWRQNIGPETHLELGLEWHPGCVSRVLIVLGNHTADNPNGINTFCC